MSTLHDAGQACNTPDASPPLAGLSIAEHVAIEHCEEIALAEDKAGDGPDEDSALCGILAFALIPSGRSLAAGLMQMAERQLFAASLISKGGHLDASAIDDGHRFIQAAIEIDRRERAGRAAELAAKEAAAKEAARLAAVPVRDPIADAAEIATVERAADDLQALAAEVRARGIGGRRGAARALARVDGARAVLFGAIAGRSSPRFLEGMRLETTLAALLAGAAS